MVSQNWEIGTLHINLNQSGISETSGSMAWLQRQQISLNFTEESVDGLTFRCAKLQIGRVGEIIAADGAAYHPEVACWTSSNGYKEIGLELDSPHRQDPAFRAPLTPDAARLAERVAELGREQFRAWLDSDRADGGIDLVLRKAARD